MRTVRGPRNDEAEIRVQCQNEACEAVLAVQRKDAIFNIADSMVGILTFQCPHCSKYIRIFDSVEPKL